MINTMHSKFFHFDSVLFIILVGLRSLIGDKVISNFLTFNNNVAFIFHVFFWRWLGEKAGIKSRTFYNLNKRIIVTELKTYFIFYCIHRAKRWCSWLRHCFKWRNVGGSIPGVVLGNIFNHIFLGSTEPLREMNTRNVFWDVKPAGG